MLGAANLRDEEYNKPSNLERQFKFMKKLNDPRFGEVSLMQNPQTRENVFVRERKYNDKAEAARAILAARSRLQNQSPYSLKMLDYSSAKQSELCSTIYIVRQFWEAPGADLRREFSQRQSSQSYFTDAELSYIIYNIIRGNNAGTHGDICPSNISYDRATNTAKLIDRSDEPPSPQRTIQIQKNKLINPQNIYQSPNMYSNLKRNNLKFGIDGSKEDAFSLGLTMLELGNLKPISNIYDSNRKEVDRNILMGHVNEFANRYGRNQFLNSMVSGFTRYDENDRIGLREADSTLPTEADFRNRIGSGTMVTSTNTTLGGVGGMNTGGMTTTTTTTTVTDQAAMNAGMRIENPMMTQTTTQNTYSGNLAENPYMRQVNLNMGPLPSITSQTREYAYNPPREVIEYQNTKPVVETHVTQSEIQNPGYQGNLNIRASSLNAPQLSGSAQMNTIPQLSTMGQTSQQYQNTQQFTGGMPQNTNLNTQFPPSLPINTSYQQNQLSSMQNQPQFQQNTMPPMQQNQQFSGGFQPNNQIQNYAPPPQMPQQNYNMSAPIYNDSVRHEYRTNGMVVDPPVIHDYKGIDSSFSSTRSFDSGRYYSPVSPIGGYDGYVGRPVVYPRSFTDNYVPAPIYPISPYSASSNRIVLEPEIRQEFVTAPVTTTYSSAGNILPMSQQYIEAPMSIAPQVVYAAQPAQTLVSAAPQVLYASAAPEAYATTLAAPAIQTYAAPSIQTIATPSIVPQTVAYAAAPAATILQGEAVTSGYMMPTISAPTTVLQAAPATILQAAPTFSSATNIQTVSAVPTITGISSSIVPDAGAVSGLKLVRTYQDPKFSTVI